MKATKKNTKRVRVETPTENGSSKSNLLQHPFRRGIIALPLNVSENWSSNLYSPSASSFMNNSFTQQPMNSINSLQSSLPYNSQIPSYLNQVQGTPVFSTNRTAVSNGYSIPVNPYLYGAQQIQPAVNILEIDSEYIIEMALPGYDSENCKIKIKDSVLWVYGRIENEREIGVYSVQEIGNTYFERAFILPENISTEEVESGFENGILYISLPKSEETERTEREILISDEVFEN